MIVVFYSLATGWHHQVSVLDANDTPRKPRDGEGMQTVDSDVFNAWLAQMKLGGDRDPIQEYLNTFTGMTPEPCEYAIVENGVVVNVVGRADPALGHLDSEIAKGAAAVLTTEKVVEGATYDGQTFTKPADPVVVKDFNLGR